MDESLFDEFGNYIGPEQQEHPDDRTTADYHDHRPSEELNGLDYVPPQSGSFYRQEIVLHEDKKNYLTAEEVYGEEVETIVHDEDTQPLSEPIIAPVKTKHFQEVYSSLPTTFDFTYLTSLWSNSSRVRNLAIVGQIHHGKTSLIDLLVTFTHPTIKIPEFEMPRYMDNLVLEKQRGITLKAKPLTTLLPSSKGTSMILNIMDTPGHSDFADEVSVAFRMVDGIVLVVDVVEGLMCQTEMMIKTAISMGLPIILVLNKFDRLILELKLPPNDAYFKLKNVIEEINTFISNNGGSELMQPEIGNVLFASTMAGWVFSLESFSKRYIQQMGLDKLRPEDFCKRLWGEVYFSADTGIFMKAPSTGASKRTFVSFILEPLYKIYGQIISEETEKLRETLLSLGVRLKDYEYGHNTKTVLRRVFGIFFGKGSIHSLVDAISEFIPDPQTSAFKKVIQNINGPLNSNVSIISQKCSLTEPLVAFISKCYSNDDLNGFNYLVYIFSGRLTVGQQLRVINGVGDDDNQVSSVKELAIGCGRYRVSVSEVPAGNWAFVFGLDSSVSGKTATLLDLSFNTAEVCSFKPLSAQNKAHFKVAIEPITPSELPKMLDGIRKVNKTYPLLTTKVEDSGEHTLLGTGELYMDCVLHDLRRLFAEIEVKVADPVAKLSETVAEGSYIKCFAETPNHRNKLSIIAEPLEKPVTDALEAGRLPCPTLGQEHSKELARVLQNDYGWDILAARSVWAFGPDPKYGPNILIDDTLPSEVDKESLLMAKDYIIQGFQWACREGPLCEENVRGVKFKIIDASIASEAVHRGAGQIIPTARRVCYSAMLTGAPKLMEPVLFVEVQTQNEFVEAVYNALAKRRGHVTQDQPKAGSPQYIIRAYLPLMDSFGFETDLRIHTHGMAFCQMRHDHWQIVPGDPLDRSIKLIPLQPSPAPHLARDYLLKTRRRKGLSEDVAAEKFFDPEMLNELAREEAISGIKGLSV